VAKVLSVLMGVLLFSSLGPAMADSDTGDNDAGLRYWNGIKSEAVVTESGLQYKVLITGKGRKPPPRSRVRVHYRGLLTNGVTFDSSFSEDEPIQLHLKSVIKGWQEGIPLMPAGSVFVFLIPPELAYGEKGSDMIPPNATLIFEIEFFGK